MRDILINKYGQKDPTAYQVLRKENSLDEDVLIFSRITNWFFNPKRTIKKMGVGVLEFHTKEQYIKDCVEILSDEFLITVLVDDIWNLCRAKSLHQMERIKNDILKRL